MKKYTFVAPENYTLEQKKYVDDYKKSVWLLSQQTNLLLVLRDINSRYITGTDASATKFNLKRGEDFSGKFISDLPCQSFAACSKEMEQQDQNLIHSFDTEKLAKTLNVFEFSDGLRARVGATKIFYHKESAAILGIISEGINVELKNFINIVPDYITRFGALGTLEEINQNTILSDSINLNDYEQEICYLFLLSWDCSQITKFMNEFRPNPIPRTPSAIIKKKDVICNKLRLPNNNIKGLCEYLVSISFHKKLPQSFYSRIIGTKAL